MKREELKAEIKDCLRGIERQLPLLGGTLAVSIAGVAVLTWLGVLPIDAGYDEPVKSNAPVIAECVEPGEPVTAIVALGLGHYASGDPDPSEVCAQPQEDGVVLYFVEEGED